MKSSFLKHLNYADDICLLSQRVMDLGQMALNLEKETSRVGLNVKFNKIDVLSSTGSSTSPICINWSIGRVAICISRQCC